jgi:hypothetical protein
MGMSTLRPRLPEASQASLVPEFRDVRQQPHLTAAPALTRSLTAASVVALQRTAGNTAVSRMIGRHSLARCPSAAGGACHCAACAQEVENLQPEQMTPDGAETAVQDPADPTEEAGEGPLESTGEAPVGDSGEAPAETAGETPVEDSGEGPVKDSGEGPVESTGGEAPAEDSGEASVEDHGEVPVKNTGQASLEDGTEIEPAASDEQRVLQRALAATAQTRRLMRTATWVSTTVNPNRNLATSVLEGVHVGNSVPMLNGQAVTTHEQAEAAVLGPTVRPLPVAGGGFEAEFADVPENRGSAYSEVLTPGPWKTRVPKTRIAAATGLSACRSAGDTEFQAKGRGGDKNMYSGNDRHEDKHTADHVAAFNKTIWTWDRNVTDAKQRGAKFRAPTAEAAETGLWQTVDGRPERAARLFLDHCDAAGRAYHDSPQGHPVSGPTNPGCSVDCSRSWAEWSNPASR